MANEPDLRRGADGEWVTYLQQLLEAAGHSPGAIDGDFGPKTDAAVRSFQDANGLVVDGWVGPKTWGALTGGEAGQQGSGDTQGPAEGLSSDMNQWTEEQRDQYFTYNDVTDSADGLPAELDVPEIEEEATA